MKVIVGDELGLLKCIDTEKKLVHSKFGEMEKKNSVVGLNNLFENNNEILSVTHERNSYILDWANGQPIIKSQPKINLPSSVLFTSQVIKQTIDFSSVITARSDNKLNIFQYDEELELKSENEFDIKTKNLHCVKDAPKSNEIFCLFRDTPISFYDLEKNEFSFRAKNVPTDEFNLKVPIWDIDVAYSKNNNDLFYTATAYGEIRMYDRKAKSKPILDKKICQRKINRMLLSNCENYLTLGDAVGNITMHDKRKSRVC